MGYGHNMAAGGLLIGVAVIGGGWGGWGQSHQSWMYQQGHQSSYHQYWNDDDRGCNQNQRWSNDEHRCCDHQNYDHDYKRED